MGARVWQAREGELRIYDATLKYLAVKFEQMDLTLPIARNRPYDPVQVTVGGYFHSPAGPDYEEQLYSGVPVEFSLWINNEDVYRLLPALCNPYLNSPWQVGSHTWQSAKGRGSIILPSGDFYATQPFFDTQKVAVNLQTIYTSPINGSVFGISADEFYVSPGQITLSEAPDNVQLKVSGICYGNLRAIGGFPVGGTPS